MDQLVKHLLCRHEYLIQHLYEMQGRLCVSVTLAQGRQGQADPQSSLDSP